MYVRRALASRLGATRNRRPGSSRPIEQQLAGDRQRAVGDGSMERRLMTAPGCRSVLDGPRASPAAAHAPIQQPLAAAVHRKRADDRIERPTAFAARVLQSAKESRRDS